MRSRRIQEAVSQQPSAGGPSLVRASRATTTVLALLLGLAGNALAQTTDEPTFADLDRERAIQLYHQGTALLSRQSYAEAAQRFQRSLELLHGRGTLLNLAICHEHLGDFVTAWREFEMVRRQAEQANDAARYDAAREHLAWLEPQLSFISLTFSESTPREMRVELDGRRWLDSSAVQPLALGRHRISVVIEGKVPWSTEVVINRAGERSVVSVPPLEDLPAAKAGPSRPAAPRRPLPRQALIAPPAPTEEGDLSPVYIAGTATGVFAVGAVVSSILYYQRKAEYEAGTSTSPREERARFDSAVQMDWVNRVFVAGTAVGAGVTGYLVYRAVVAKRRSAPASAWGAPWVSGSGAGVHAAVRF